VKHESTASQVTAWPDGKGEGKPTSATDSMAQFAENMMGSMLPPSLCLLCGRRIDTTGAGAQPRTGDGRMDSVPALHDAPARKGRGISVCAMMRGPWQTNRRTNRAPTVGRPSTNRRSYGTS